MEQPRSIRLSISMAPTTARAVVFDACLEDIQSKYNLFEPLFPFDDKIKDHRLSPWLLSRITMLPR